MAALPDNPKLLAIALQSAANLIGLFEKHEDEIQESISEGDGDKTTFAHSITLDLGKNKQHDKLSFSIKHGSETVMTIPNPDQGDLFDPLHPRVIGGE